MEKFLCRSCPTITTDFRYLKSRTGRLNRVLDCRDCERKKARESRRARYATEAGRQSILGANQRYLIKPEVVERLSLFGKRRYAEDPDFRDRMKDGARDWRADNPERKAATARAYFQANKGEILKKSQEKESRNPWLRLRGHIRVRVCEALKASGASKAGQSVFHHLPYSLMDLKHHLESHPDWDGSWMSWSNYGTAKSGGLSWQLDHVIPQSMFRYSSMNDEDFQLCWSLLNLRPRESRANFAEGDRRDLFGDFRSFRSIMDGLRDGLLNPPPGDAPAHILERLRHVELGGSCPMTFVGLSYLDSIFLARFRAKTIRNQSLMDAASDPLMVLRVVVHMVRAGECVTVPGMLSNLKYLTRSPGHFFPGAASAVWRTYAVPGRPVFDPFLGWGGRTLGAFCAGVDRIVGCDLQPDVINGCRRVASDFSPHVTTASEFHQVDALTYLRGSDERFGLIFSSPPYMDTEDYGVESDAMREGWLDSFVFPFVDECRRHLVPGGKIALHLKDLKGAPTFTAYHSAMKAAGLSQVAKHKYNRTWSQAVYVYGLI